MGRLFLFFISALFSVCLPLRAEVKLAPIFIDTQQEDGVRYGEFLRSLPVVSPEDVIRYVQGVKYICRGGFSLQQDISIRASHFSENRILLEGIDIGSPQSGHLSLDLPFTRADLEEIRLDKDKNQLSFKLKPPRAGGGTAEVSGGMYGFRQNLLSFNVPAGRLRNRLSFELLSASAYRPDRDFSAYKLSWVSYCRRGLSWVKFVMGLSKKDFGAGGLYAAPWYNQEEEHTQNLILSLPAQISFPAVNWLVTPFFNRHFDKFYLDRNNPSFYTNYHTSYRYGLNSRIAFRKLPLSLGTEWRGEKITSTRLGGHKRSIYKGLLSAGPFYAANFAFKLDFLESFYPSGREEEFEAEADYSLPQGQKIKLKLSRFFNLPSFTDLYYDSPSNKGSPGLSPVRTDNVYLGWSSGRGRGYSLGVFWRRVNNRIDWLKAPSDSFYQAYNISEVKIKGAEAEIHSLLRFSRCKARLSVAYDYVNSTQPAAAGVYKYSHIFVKHQIIGIAAFDIGKTMRFSLIGRYQKTNRHISFLVVDVKLVKDINAKLSFFIEGSNVFNKKYQLIDYVDSPPRFWRGGVRVRF